MLCEDKTSQVPPYSWSRKSPTTFLKGGVIQQKEWGLGKILQPNLDFIIHAVRAWIRFVAGQQKGWVEFLMDTVTAYCMQHVQMQNLQKVYLDIHNKV